MLKWRKDSILFFCSDRKTYFCDIKMSMKPIF